MNLDRRTFLGTVAAGAVGFAGCAGAGGGDPTGTTTMATETTTQTTMATETKTQTTMATTTGTGTAGATVQVRSHPDYGDILVDAGGATLYLFESDTRGSGESTCTGGCADNWPPLTVDDTPSKGDGVSAPLSTLERADGTAQVTADGWPLYYFAPDEGPGDAKGQGVGDAWWVVDPSGSPVKPSTTDTSSKGGSY